MTRRVLVAGLFAVVLMVGAIAVLHATDAPGRCMCTTMGWGVWDWEFWWNGCDTPLPYPECGGG